MQQLAKHKQLTNLKFEGWINYADLPQHINNFDVCLGIFGDTPNYKKNADTATYHGNWNRQTSIILQKNPLKRYIRVVPEGTSVFEAKDLKKFTNYSEITVQEFKRRFHL